MGIFTTITHCGHQEQGGNPSPAEKPVQAAAHLCSSPYLPPSPPLSSSACVPFSRFSNHFCCLSTDRRRQRVRETRETLLLLQCCSVLAPNSVAQPVANCKRCTFCQHLPHCAQVLKPPKKKKEKKNVKLASALNGFGQVLDSSEETVAVQERGL